MRKRIFTFWENKKGESSPPAYLELCMETWRNNIPGLELVVINHDNLYEWIDEDYITRDDLRRMSLPQQKDAISYWIIYKYGGVFLDADTIIIKDIFEEIEKLDDKLYFFGSPESRVVHVGALFCKQTRNKALFLCIYKAQKVLEENRKTISSYTGYKIIEFLKSIRRVILGRKTEIGFFLPGLTFGNCIVNPILRDSQFVDNVGIIDRVESGAIIESSFYFNKGKYGKMKNYRDFYFGKNDIDLADVINKIDFGLSCLHNTWTPKEYKQYDYKTIKEDKSLMSKLLMYALQEKE